MHSEIVICLHKGERSQYNVGAESAGHLPHSSTFQQREFRLQLYDRNMTSKLQQCMIDLITVFHTYSGKEGDKYKLSRGELKTLLQVELAELMAECKDPAALEKILSALDGNKDGEVDFQEFAALAVGLTVLCNEFFVDMDKKKGK
ncbi:protein S100-A1-like [Labrus mixtus]|uniref:protein S100-A1-like n=1 Tax=Labrus mixtus TaxID=508554 RepID=UPI0029C01FB2|nr:protein S100-A1-like [Labrus mixtus]